MKGKRWSKNHVGTLVAWLLHCMRYLSTILKSGYALAVGVLTEGEIFTWASTFGALRLLPQRAFLSLRIPLQASRWKSGKAISRLLFLVTITHYRSSLIAAIGISLDGVDGRESRRKRTAGQEMSKQGRGDSTMLSSVSSFRTTRIDQ